VPVTNKMELGRELSRTIAQLHRQIEEVQRQADKAGVTPYQLRDPYGTWLMPPLLAAKAQCLHALAIVNQKD
jgi:hypothetical protein